MDGGKRWTEMSHLKSEASADVVYMQYQLDPLGGLALIRSHSFSVPASSTHEILKSFFRTHNGVSG